MGGLATAKANVLNKSEGMAAGWEQVSLDERIVEMQSGFSCARELTVSHGVPHLRPFNIGIDGEIDLREVLNIPTDYRANIAAYELQPGDVLFNNTNSVELVGKTAIVRSPLRCGFSNHLTRLRIRDKNWLDSTWLALCLRTLWQRGFFAQHCNRWIGQAGFNPTKLANLAIPIPPIDFQRRIVARIEALLAEVKKARTLLTYMRHDAELLMKAALKEVFGHVRDGFEVARVPSHQAHRIDDVAKLERGKFSHRPRNDPRFFGGTVPWVQIQNLPRSYGKYITEYMNTLNDQGVAISKIFPKGTLVLSIAATIGAAGILSFDACFPDSLVGVTPEADSVDAGFLYWQLVFLRDHLDTIAPSAAQKNINLQILSRINLWTPPLEEQKAINNHLDSVQSYAAEIQQMLDQNTKILDQLEQSILEQAFRGEL